MKLVYFKELEKYKISDIINILDTDIDNSLKVIESLQIKGIVKKYNQSISEQLIEDKKTYIFDFVGIISVYKYVIICYPKYINKLKSPLNEMKQILKVIEHYNSKKSKENIFNYLDEESENNEISISLYLINDYLNNGLYAKEIDEVEVNGEGEILWDETIDESYAILNNNKAPIYLEMRTENTVENDSDFYTRLHKCILTECSNTLKKIGILSLLEKEEINIYEGNLEDFGDLDYLLYRIKQELNIQYISYKQNILQGIYIYLLNKNMYRDELPTYVYGTSSFNLIWQDVCSQAFNNMINNKIKDLPCISSLDKINNNNSLKDIDKPLWKYFMSNKVAINEAARTIIPDIISVYKVDDKYCFGILDAKYYNIKLDEEKVLGQPGVEDIIKQYVYFLAYKELINKSDCIYVQNAFLFPDEEQENKIIGETAFNILSDQIKNCTDIAVIKLSAVDLYNIYLRNSVFEDIDKIIGHVKFKTN